MPTKSKKIKKIKKAKNEYKPSAPYVKVKSKEEEAKADAQLTKSYSEISAYIKSLHDEINKFGAIVGTEYSGCYDHIVYCATAFDCISIQCENDLKEVYGIDYTYAKQALVQLGEVYYRLNSTSNRPQQLTADERKKLLAECPVRK